MAESALNAIPFIAIAFKSCVTKFSFFTDIETFPRDSHTLLWKFRIQETRLKVWGREWGGLQSDITQGGVRVQGEGDQLQTTSVPLIRDEDDVWYTLETLDRIEKLLGDYEKLRKIYGLTLVTKDGGTSLGVVEAMDALSLNSTAQDYLQQDLQVHLEKRKKDSGFFKRVRWIAVDKSKLETMIRDLKAYNDGLYHQLSAAERRVAKQALAPELINTNDLKDISHLEEASIGQGSILQETVSLKKHILQIENATGENSIYIGTRQQIARLKIPVQTLSEIRPSEASRGGEQERSLAVYSRHAATGNEKYLTVDTVIEWRKYGSDMPLAVKSAIRDRITNLACFLNMPNVEGLSVPKCLGYVDYPDRSRIGLVFESMSHASTHLSSTQCIPAASDFISLQKLMALKGQAFLGDRFKLAFKIAFTMSILHTAGWLHKGFRSDNILFARENNTSSSDLLENPRLFGFEFTRPNSAYALSSLIISTNQMENMYRHPRVQGDARERFSMADDIYALGIVLMEIGFWRPISEFWNKKYTPEKFQEVLWCNYVPQLGNKVGKIYMEVVERCITGRLRGSDGQVGEALDQKDIFWNIVKPLSTLVA